MKPDKSTIIAAAAMSCFAAALILKLDGAALSLFQVPESWLQKAKIVDHLLVILGGILLAIYSLVQRAHRKANPND